MNFINTDIGMVNLDHVVAVRKAPNKGAYLIMVDGREEATLAGFDEVSARLRPIIPNTTPILAVEMVHDENEVHVMPVVTPIIGWRLGELFAEPLLPDGETATHLLFPDGRVEHINNGMHRDLQDATVAYARDNKLSPRETEGR